MCTVGIYFHFVCTWFDLELTDHALQIPPAFRAQLS